MINTGESKSNVRMTVPRIPAPLFFFAGIGDETSVSFAAFAIVSW
jgi:hypothetical protein